MSYRVGLSSLSISVWSVGAWRGPKHPHMLDGYYKVIMEDLPSAEKAAGNQGGYCRELHNWFYTIKSYLNWKLVEHFFKHRPMSEEEVVFLK